MQENLMQRLKKTNKVKILEINLKNDFNYKFDTQPRNNDFLKKVNLQNLISNTTSTNNFIKLDELNNFLYVIKVSNKFYGPFFWDEEFKPISIPAYILNINDPNKKIFLLKLFKTKLKRIKLDLKIDNNNLITIFINQENEIEQNRKLLDKQELEFFIKQKVKLNKILNNNQEVKIELFEQIANELFKTFFPENLLANNILYIFNVDKLLSSVPLELINYLLIKYNSFAIFEYKFVNQLTKIYHNYKEIKGHNYLDLKNSNTLRDNKNYYKNKNNNYNDYDKKDNKNSYLKSIYIYSDPEPYNIKEEIKFVSKIDNIDILKIFDFYELVEILNKYNNIIFSGHGLLKNNINTIIINNKPFPISYIKNIPKSPDFFYFSSCLTTTGFFNNNFYISLLKKDLSESLTTQFLINEKLSFSFFKDFISSSKILNYPLINYIYSLFKNYNTFSFINKYTILDNNLEKYFDFII